MRSVFYDKKKGVWLDYNLRTERLNSEFYGYIAVPLFTKCYQQLNLRKSFQIVEFMNVSILRKSYIALKNRILPQLSSSYRKKMAQ